MSNFPKEYKTGLTIQMPESQSAYDVQYEKIHDVIECYVQRNGGLTVDHTKNVPGENITFYLYCMEGYFNDDSARELVHEIASKLSKFCRIVRQVNYVVNSGATQPE